MNAFQEWLGLDFEDPNFYQLFGLAAFETDTRKIELAADRAMAKVRSCRPGPHAEIWADLLDQLADAKRVLTDPERRAEYDRHLNSGNSTTPRERSAQPARRAEHVTDNRQLDPFGAGLDESPVDEPPATTGAAGISAPQPLPIEPGEPITRAAEPLESGDAEPPINPFLPTPPNARDDSRPGDPLLPPDLAQPPGGLPPEAQTSRDFDSVLQAVLDVSDTTASPAVTGATAMVQAQPQLANAVNPSSPTNSARTRSGMLLPVLVGITAGLIVLLVFGLWESMQQRPDAARSATPSKFRAGVDDRAVSGDAQTSLLGDQAIRTPSGAAARRSNEASTGARNDPNLTQNPMDRGQDAPAQTEESPVSTEANDPVQSSSSGSLAPEASRAEVRALGDALGSVRRALTARRFAAATKQLATARSLAKSAEHRAMVRRLQHLSVLVSEFYATAQQAAAALEAGEEIAVSPSTVVSVVEIEGDSLTLFVAGRHKQFRLDDMSPGLAMALVARSLGEDNPRLPLLKGAYLAVHARTTAAELETVRELWNAASLSNPVAKALLATLDDDYTLADGE